MAVAEDSPNWAPIALNVASEGADWGINGPARSLTTCSSCGTAMFRPPAIATHIPTTRKAHRQAISVSRRSAAASRQLRASAVSRFQALRPVDRGSSGGIRLGRSSIGADYDVDVCAAWVGRPRVQQASAEHAAPIQVLHETIITRRQAGRKNKGMKQLSLYSEERGCAAPTAARVLDVFTGLAYHHLTDRHGRPVHSFAPQLTELQALVLDLIDIPHSIYTA